MTLNAMQWVFADILLIKVDVRHETPEEYKVEVKYKVGWFRKLIKLLWK